MVPSVMDVLFGCTHRRFSFPITPNRKQARCAAAEATGTYVACLECGQEFPYDWEKMRVLPQRAAATAALAGGAFARKAA